MVNRFIMFRYPRNPICYKLCIGPVVGAPKGITTAIRDLISNIIEPLAKLVTDGKEAQSTEELLRGVPEANEHLTEVPVLEVVPASIDVTALYPSIDQV